MNDLTMVFGHKNPDTDSVTSAIALAHLKCEQGLNAIPYVLGDIPKEAQYVLDFFNVKAPEKIDNVKIQMKDIDYDIVEPLRPNHSILMAYHHMNQYKIRTLPIVDENDHLQGIITMKDIAMNTINGDSRTLNTTFENLKRDLNAYVMNYSNPVVKGTVVITAFHKDTIIENEIFNDKSVVITGDRFEIIDYAIRRNVQLIIVTGGQNIPQVLKDRAAVSRVNILITPYDTYDTAKIINQTNFISTIMKSKRLVKFKETAYMDHCKEIVQTSKHSKFPIVSDDGKFLGIIGRTHFLNPSKKKVILVDHNEYGQSADGLQQADVLEIIDHHKLGDISTPLPISFRNVPVGSTNTIVYMLYREAGLEIPTSIAGLMMAGIISDTLYLKSPTTTAFDVDAVKTLSDQIGISAEQFAMDMFKNGTSLEGKTANEVLFTDFKMFSVDGQALGISQVFTLNHEDVLSEKDRYLALIDELHHKKEHFITLMLVTDIIKEGSYILYATEHEPILSLAFGVNVHQGVFVENCVSRKKQVIPRVIQAMSTLK